MIYSCLQTVNVYYEGNMLRLTCMLFVYSSVAMLLFLHKIVCVTTLKAVYMYM